MHQYGVVRRPTQRLLSVLATGALLLTLASCSAGSSSSSTTSAQQLVIATLFDVSGTWDPLESTCRHASLSIL